MTHEVVPVQASYEKAKKALFFLNEALCELSMVKPNDLLSSTPCAKNTIEPIETLKDIYRRINLCIDDASSIRDHLLTLEIYNLTFPYSKPISAPPQPSPIRKPTTSFPIPTSSSPITTSSSKHSLPPDPEDFDDDDSINPLPNDLMEPPDTQLIYNTDDSDEKEVE